MAGPMPKDPSQRRRRNATPGFELLPAEGRQGPAPAWPFGKPTADQKAKWDELWHLPQAIKWEQMHSEDSVALYVIALFAYLEDPSSTQAPKRLGEVRQLDAKLGISPKAMLNIRWTIAPKDSIEVIETEAVANKKARVYIPPESEKS